MPAMTGGANLGKDQKWGSQFMSGRAEEGKTPAVVDTEDMSYGDMASAGRGGDTEMAHVTPGEIMIPPSVWADNPKLQETIKRAFLSHGEDPASFLAGSSLQKINPTTGQPEFFGGFIGKIVNKVLRNKIVKTVLPVAAAFIPGIGPLASAAIGAGIGAYGGGGIKGAILGGISGYGSSALAGGLRAAGQVPLAGINFAPGTVTGGISNILSGVPGSMNALSSALIPSNIGGFASAALKAAPMLAGFSSSGQPAPSVPKETVSVAPQNPQNLQQSSVPTTVPTAAATVPKGAGAPPSGVGLASSVPAGVSFLQPLTNRNTGQTDYTETPFSGALSSIRRGSFGGAIFA